MNCCRRFAPTTIHETLAFVHMDFFILVNEWASLWFGFIDTHGM